MARECREGDTVQGMLVTGIDTASKCIVANIEFPELVGEDSSELREENASEKDELGIQGPEELDPNSSGEVVPRRSNNNDGDESAEHREAEATALAAEGHGENVVIPDIRPRVSEHDEDGETQRDMSVGNREAPRTDSTGNGVQEEKSIAHDKPDGNAACPTHVVKKQDWYCASCGTMNFARRDACFECLTDRRGNEAGDSWYDNGLAQDVGDDTWICDVCFSNNSADDQECWYCCDERAGWQEPGTDEEQQVVDLLLRWIDESPSGERIGSKLADFYRIHPWTRNYIWQGRVKALSERHPELGFVSGGCGVLFRQHGCGNHERDWIAAQLDRAEEEIRQHGPRDIGEIGGRLQLKKQHFESDTRFELRVADRRGMIEVSLIKDKQQAPVCTKIDHSKELTWKPVVGRTTGTAGRTEQKLETGAVPAFLGFCSICGAHGHRSSECRDVIAAVRTDLPTRETRNGPRAGPVAEASASIEIAEAQRQPSVFGEEETSRARSSSAFNGTECTSSTLNGAGCVLSTFDGTVAGCTADSSSTTDDTAAGDEAGLSALNGAELISNTFGSTVAGSTTDPSSALNGTERILSTFNGTAANDTVDPLGVSDGAAIISSTFDGTAAGNTTDSLSTLAGAVTSLVASDDSGSPGKADLSTLNGAEGFPSTPDGETMQRQGHSSDLDGAVDRNHTEVNGSIAGQGWSHSSTLNGAADSKVRNESSDSRPGGTDYARNWIREFRYALEREGLNSWTVPIECLYQPYGDGILDRLGYRCDNRELDLIIECVDPESSGEFDLDSFVGGMQWHFWYRNDDSTHHEQGDMRAEAEASSDHCTSIAPQASPENGEQDDRLSQKAALSAALDADPRMTDFARKLIDMTEDERIRLEEQAAAAGALAQERIRKVRELALSLAMTSSVTRNAGGGNSGHEGSTVDAESGTIRAAESEEEAADKEETRYDSDPNDTRRSALHSHALKLESTRVAWRCDGCGEKSRDFPSMRRFHCVANCDFDLCDSCCDEQMVETPRAVITASGKGSRSQPAWVCRNCGRKQFARRSDCWHCHSLKPQIESRELSGIEIGGHSRD